MTTASTEHKKVVIIDDEVDLSLLLQSFLSKKGYEVIISHTIADGLAALKEHQPSILFLDNNLPDGIGWEIAPQLAEEYSNMFQFLISAFHPVQPNMPQGSRYLIIEKPVSLSEIDNCFAANNF